VHRLFAAKVGAEHIATLTALEYLAALCREHPVKSVLEFGAGIGTLTYLLLKVLPSDARIVCAERHEWCRQQFETNIPNEQRGRVKLLPEGRPELHDVFDMVVVDGPVTAGAHYVREGTLFFIEGARTKTWRSISEFLQTRNLTCSPTEYSLGGSYWKKNRFGLPRRWKKNRFGLPVPKKSRIKGCWIGVVQAAAPASGISSAA
jgi:hypothetical protein